jgi:hypothetical protein
MSASGAQVLMTMHRKRCSVLLAFQNQILQQVCVVNFLVGTHRTFHSMSYFTPISICMQRLYM